MKLKMTRLKPEHAAITPYLRQSDIDEITAFTGISPDLAVAYSIAATERGFAVFLDGRLCAVFGVAHGGIIWLVGTDDITCHPITFYRVSRRIFNRLNSGYSHLENYVDTRNNQCLRWLKWLGFSIDTPKPHGAGGFHHVIWTRKEE